MDRLDSFDLEQISAMFQDETFQTNRILVPSGQIYDRPLGLTFTFPQPNSASRSFGHSVHQQTEQDRSGCICAPKNYGNCVVGREAGIPMQDSDFSEAIGVTMLNGGVPSSAQAQHIDDGVIQKKRKAPPDGNSSEQPGKRPRSTNWTPKETKKLLKWKRKGFMQARRRGQRVTSWNKDVSKCLYEKYGYDRNHDSCRERWDTVLKDYKAISEYDSQIDLNRGSNCIRYFDMTEDQRSKYDKLPKAFPEDCYELMESIILAEGDDLVKKSLRLKKGTRSRTQKGANIASTSTQNASTITEPSYNSQGQVSIIPPVASFIPSTQGCSQQHQDEVFNGVLNATVDGNDLIAKVTAIVSRQIQPQIKSALNLVLAKSKGDAVPYGADQAGVVNFNVDTTLEHGHKPEDFNPDMLFALDETNFPWGSQGSNVLENMDSQMQTLKAAEDKFGGVVIDSLSLPHDASVFLDSLKYSLVHWRAQGNRGVWLKLPLALSHLVHPAIQEGFSYHHAEPTYVMLVTWLAADVPSTIPANASHQVGIGAFVLNDNHEILAVQEKSGVFQGAGIWKMPTGSVNQGEDIFAGAIREVKEETGIDTEFVEVIGFRQSHKVAFEKSDIFFLCVLRPLTSQITIQDSELTAVKWMPLAEYRDQAYLKQRKLLKKMLDVCIATIEEPGYKGFQIKDMQAGAIGRRPQYFYYNAADCQE